MHVVRSHGCGKSGTASHGSEHKGQNSNELWATDAFHEVASVSWREICSAFFTTRESFPASSGYSKPCCQVGLPDTACLPITAVPKNVISTWLLLVTRFLQLAEPHLCSRK